MIQTLIQKTIDPKWKFTQSGQVAMYLQNGLERLPGLFGFSDIDDERIIDYIVYQIYRSRTAIAEGSWQHTWLFSQNAMEKYKKQFMSVDGKHGMNYYINYGHENEASNGVNVGRWLNWLTASVMRG